MDSQGPIARGVVALVLGVVASLLAVAPAAADTFTPTRFDDPTPGRCKPADCSLREAIRASNNREGHDTVALKKGTYDMQLSPDPAFDSGSFNLIDGLTVRGLGPRKSVIDGNGIDKVIQSSINGAPDAFTLVGLTVTGGRATTDVLRDGGGIDVGSFQDSLSLREVAVTGNTARENGGGMVTRGVVSIIDSTITGNTAGRGGGIALLSENPASSTTIRNSRIAANRATFGGGVYGVGNLRMQQTTIAGNIGDEGGGMDLVGRADQSPVTEILASTISQNTARKGGGILVDGNQPRPGLQKPVVSLTNSTVAGNSTTAEGGGVMADNGATVTLDNATIAFNRADSDGVNGGVGGGVHQNAGAIFGLADSIVAANTTTGTTQQCAGTFSNSEGLVLQTQGAFCPIDGEFKIVPDVLIGPLAPNGGPTRTVEVLTGSHAIGFASTCPKRDQRKVERPAEDCDSGAFERTQP